MSKIMISRGDDTQIAPHFLASEFYSNSPNAPASHPFYTELVEAASFLRERFGVQWRITSTFRTPENELRICLLNKLPVALATTSQHVQCRAFDSQPAGTEAENARIMEQLADDFTSNGPIFQKLRQIGITGFGLYRTFIHLDVRTGPVAHPDKYGHYACWDERTGVTKKLIGRAAWIPTRHTTTRPAPAPSPSSRS